MWECSPRCPSRTASFCAEYVAPLSSVRFSSSQACSTLRHIYEASAQLQYDFVLHTSSYLDVPYSSPATQPSDAAPPGDSPSAEAGPSAERPPVANAAQISVARKTALLADRERRWETLDWKSKHVRNIQGPAGVYELQEGIFLMCEDVNESNDGRVSVACATARRLAEG